MNRVQRKVDRPMRSKALFTVVHLEQNGMRAIVVPVETKGSESTVFL